MKSKSYIAAFVAAVFGTMMFAAPAVAGGHHYPPPPEKCYESVVDVPEHTIQVVDVAEHTIQVVDVPEHEVEVIVTAAHWQRYSANGSWKEAFAPDFPSDYWQPNVQGDPHGIGQEGPYDVSNEHSGNVDWFYLEWVPADIDIEIVPATYKDEIENTMATVPEPASATLLLASAGLLARRRRTRQAPAR